MTHQTLPSMGFPRQAYWSGLQFPSPGEKAKFLFHYDLLQASDFLILKHWRTVRK